jgi:hypothetical protein
MNCNWKLDGKPMDPLKADDPKLVPISAGKHLIQAATTDGVTKIRIDAEIDQRQKTVEIQLKSEHDQELKRRKEETIRKQTEAEAAVHPTWTDPDTGLMWTKKDNGSDVSWNQANDYCTKLQLAGSKDWRLPTIQELQGIDDPSASVEAVFDEGSIVGVHVRGDLRLTGWVWSSSLEDAREKPLRVPWHFNFGDERAGDSFGSGFSYSMRALCVRRSGE